MNSVYKEAYIKGKELAKLASLSKLANPFGGGRNPLGGFDYDREPMPKRQKNPNTVRRKKDGYTLPSDKDIQTSTGDLITSSLEAMHKVPAPLRGIFMSRRERDAIGDEYIRRRKGDPGNFSRDYSTMQRDVDRLGDYIAGNYTPKLPEKKTGWLTGDYYETSKLQDKNPQQAPDYTSDQTARILQTGDLREGIRFGRLPANVIRPRMLEHYGVAGDKQVVRPHYGPSLFDAHNHEGESHKLGPRYKEISLFSKFCMFPLSAIELKYSGSPSFLNKISFVLE